MRSSLSCRAMTVVFIFAFLKGSRKEYQHNKFDIELIYTFLKGLDKRVVLIDEINTRPSLNKNIKYSQVKQSNKGCGTVDEKVNPI